MTTTASWLIPIILLPGVALLITSTSARFSQIHEEIHGIIQSNEAIEANYRLHLLRRATYFRNALVSLYISVAAFAIGSVLGALFDLMQGPTDLAVFIFAFVGIIGLILAAVLLILESILSLQVIQHHMDMIHIDD